MSGTRPPNKVGLAKNPIPDLSDENEEKQKKARLDQSFTESTTSSATVSSTSFRPAFTTSSIHLHQAKVSGISFIPRQLLTKQKPVITTMSSGTSQVVSSSTFSNEVISPTPTMSSAPPLVSLPTPIVPSTKTSGYFLLEKELAKVGDIANYIKIVAKKTNKTDDDCFAVSYGLIVMAGMIDDIKQYKSTVYIPYITQLGMDYKFPSYDVYSLQNTLEVILQIRVILADHFIRAEQHLHLKTVFELGDDIAKLAALNVKNEENPINNKSTMWLIQMETTFRTKQIEKQPVSYVNRVHRIISALQNVEALYAADPTLSSLPSIFAASMLVVIAGTCAREISRASDIRLTTFFNTPEGEEVKEQLELLNDIRGDLAHHKGHNTLEFLSKTFKSINMQENTSQKEEKKTYLTRLEPYLRKVYTVLGHSLEAASSTTPKIK